MWKTVLIIVSLIAICDCKSANLRVKGRCPKGRNPGDEWTLKGEPCSACYCQENRRYECNTCDHIEDDTSYFNKVPKGCHIGPKETGEFPICCLDTLICPKKKKKSG